MPKILHVSTFKLLPVIICHSSKQCSKADAYWECDKWQSTNNYDTV